jgi:type II secretory pathway predicted ATPase ExeA
MYMPYFGLRREPFGKEIDVSELFVSADLTEAGSRLKYMTETRGIFLLIGEPGSGKTVAIRRFSKTLGSTLYKACYLSLTTLTVNDFFSALVSMLGEQPRYRKIDMFRQIQDAICEFYYNQKITPVIIVDEIHMASIAILDDLRMLFNFRMDAADPYILILSGQTHIRNKLVLNACLPLKQRIRLKYAMQGLNESETSQYINHRMHSAGATDNLFLPESLTAIHAASNGFPRNINNLATHCLMYLEFYVIFYQKLFAPLDRFFRRAPPLALRLLT